MEIISVTNKARAKAFVRFLKHNGVYTKYLSYYRSGIIETSEYKRLQRGCMVYHEKLLSLFYPPHGSFKMWIYNAFPWSCTKEGYYFWEHIHFEWVAEAEWLEHKERTLSCLKEG